MTNDIVIAVDVAKSVFEVGVSDRTSPRAASVKSRDGRTGRTGAGTAENNFGLRGRCIDWLPARGFRHGPERSGAPSMRPEIRLQSARFPHRATPSLHKLDYDQRTRLALSLERRSPDTRWSAAPRAMQLMHPPSGCQDPCICALPPARRSRCDAVGRSFFGWLGSSRWSGGPPLRRSSHPCLPRWRTRSARFIRRVRPQPREALDGLRPRVEPSRGSLGGRRE
jgi:hypothetical protein